MCFVCHKMYIYKFPFQEFFPIWELKALQLSYPFINFLYNFLYAPTRIYNALSMKKTLIKTFCSAPHQHSVKSDRIISIS
jgi:hypothetical protein